MAEPEPFWTIPAHLSEKARIRDANVFFWWTSHSNTALLACLNAEVTPVTVQTVLRWMALGAQWSREMVIKKVRLRQLGPFLYQALPRSEHPLDRSVVIEPQEIYGFFHPDPKVYLHSLPLYGLYYRETLKAGIQAQEEIETSTPVPQWFLDMYFPNFASAISRPLKIEDLWKTEVKCILPFGERPHSSDSDPSFTSDGNVVPMRGDVYELWLGNMFSVDVDDDYRIRTFSRAAAKIGFPDKLVDPDKRWATFFREHMRYTISVAFFGGDLYIETQGPEKLALMGAARRGDFSDSEKWQTALGREIMQGTLAMELRRIGGRDDVEED
ncbi:uncharacterized protein TRAVEDRAFT_52050 [Trametes versicolor FP-101664 SS1]|uniref:uncharacterized protein n=1 Tax=Trametes versicolor (strain FP-101664) TaxID=717944 RepID=UPI0004623320|nr:uncharacterized protein TRAVEDRAFT_52050 [Trametes versicolor FP-101664 SS1]EIW54341.1 hypothetical protein TRAVEDRAFT_52050 [Trametes versicolor FP-101664 SS1]